MWGVLLSLAWNSEKWRTIILENARYVFVASLLLFFGVVYMSYYNFTFGGVFSHSWLAVFYSTVILLALILSEKNTRSFFDLKALQWLGLRSYAIYLLHLPVKVIGLILFSQVFYLKLGIWFEVGIFTVLTLLFAEISYHILEKPFINLAHKAQYVHEK
jgi:peptidoglycan/LPS O-acetylase OafA/YrhL